jgi:hypothetical protein
MLPEPEDETEAKVVADVREHGWHVITVRAAAHDHDDESLASWSGDPAVEAAYDADFAYTIGLTHSFGHPEVILVGGWEHSHPYLNLVGDLVRAGRRFGPGDTSDGVLDGFGVRFAGVSDACRKELLTWADWAAGREPFEALQLVFPDPFGRWPEEDGYRGFPQPALGELG